MQPSGSPCLALLRSPLRLFAGLAVVLLGACGGDGGAVGSDLAAVATWELELVHEIGSISDPDQMLTDPSITNVILAPDGSLLIGQPMDAEIRVYDEAGTFSHTIGRRGEGPAEIGGFNNFGLTPDGDVWVHDAGNYRMTRYSFDGTYLDGEAWPGVVDQVGGGMLAWGFGGSLRQAPDGSALATAMYALPGGAEAARDVGPHMVRRMHPGGVLGDTVLAIGKLLASDTPDGMTTRLRTDLLVAPSVDGTRVYWVERSTLGNPDPGVFRVGAVDAATGDTLFIRALPYDPIPTPMDELRAEYAGRGELWNPETFPPVTRVIPTSDGPLWLAREQRQDPQLWWALDPATGAHVGLLTLPLGEMIRDQRGDVLVTSREDDLDVPYIRRYRVVR